jgi:hypothetical protein
MDRDHEHAMLKPFLSTRGRIRTANDMRKETERRSHKPRTADFSLRPAERSGLGWEKSDPNPEKAIHSHLKVRQPGRGYRARMLAMSARNVSFTRVVRSGAAEPVNRDDRTPGERMEEVWYLTLIALGWAHGTEPRLQRSAVSVQRTRG